MKSMPIYSKDLDANLRDNQILYRCRLFKTPDTTQPLECVIVATRILMIHEFAGNIRIKLGESSPFSTSVTETCVADAGWRTTKKKAIESLEKRINDRRFFLNQELRELTKRSIAVDALKSQLLGAKNAAQEIELEKQARQSVRSRSKGKGRAQS